MPASLPLPPYWTVIFSSQRTDGDQGYAEMAERMMRLASVQPGFLGVESARDENGFGITVSYWDSVEAIAAWRHHAEHMVAQRLGREVWYQAFSLKVARVERAHDFTNPRDDEPGPD
ncbi:antibiotic biosynthesis monooxygenase [Pseudogulbenkiania sp. MAI-1]|uniref:antibiotic biosynthesis monooxygenase family protein n=1 Tax=Pseudogulbenkiania sp. MAI-1 TaxID=990370 RepID=UPI00045E5D1F|nr:antibiotic biosynthesis monooxygenase [Pseudogulbenkiania sp. MAI-1]